MDGVVKPSTPLESKSKSFLISLCMLLNEILSERKSSKEHKEVNRRETTRGKERMYRAQERYRARPRGKEVARLKKQRYLATPEGKEMRRLAQQRYEASPKGKARRQRYRATPRVKEMRCLEAKRYYERTKHLRKLCQSENKIRIEASSQDIDLGDNVAG